MVFVTNEVCHIIWFVLYDVCHLIGFVAYDICRIMTFVTNYDICSLEGLSQYRFLLYSISIAMLPHMYSFNLIIPGSLCLTMRCPTVQNSQWEIADADSSVSMTSRRFLHMQISQQNVNPFRKNPQNYEYGLESSKNKEEENLVSSDQRIFIIDRRVCTPPLLSGGSTHPTSLRSVCSILQYLSVCITADRAGRERLYFAVEQTYCKYSYIHIK